MMALLDPEGYNTPICVKEAQMGWLSSRGNLYCSAYMPWFVFQLKMSKALFLEETSGRIKYK